MCLPTYIVALDWELIRVGGSSVESGEYLEFLTYLIYISTNRNQINSFKDCYIYYMLHDVHRNIEMCSTSQFQLWISGRNVHSATSRERFYIASSFFSLPCLFASNNLDLVKYDRKPKHNNRATQISCCPEAALTHAFNMIEPSQTHRFVYRAWESQILSSYLL